ncbi:MAG: TlpA disulfide reductase family protein [Terricaulis sp.]
MTPGHASFATSLRRAAVAICALVFATAAAAERASVLNQPAPDCALAMLGEPRATSLNALRGQVVYLDFWASWCGPCAASFPFMNALERDLRGRGLRVVGANMDARPADATRFLVRRPAQFAVAVGDNAPCARALGVAGLPYTFLIDRNGVVRRVHSGFRRGDAPSLRADVERLLAEPVSGGQTR